MPLKNQVYILINYLYKHNAKFILWAEDYQLSLQVFLSDFPFPEKERG